MENLSKEIILFTDDFIQEFTYSFKSYVEMCAARDSNITYNSSFKIPPVTFSDDFMVKHTKIATFKLFREKAYAFQAIKNKIQLESM